MKKDEIKVGAEYAVSTSNDWQKVPGHVRRVRVTGPAVKSGGKFSWDPVRYEFPVAYLHPETGAEHSKGYVSSRSVRQDWPTYVAEQEERNRQADAQARVRREADARRLEEVRTIKEKFVAIVGREPEYRLNSSLDSYATYAADIKISVADLNALLEA